MGVLIVLEEWRADRSRPTRDPRPAFFFDLACPFSYLAAERVERALGEVEWIPTAGVVLRRGDREPDGVVLRRGDREPDGVVLRRGDREPHDVVPRCDREPEVEALQVEAEWRALELRLPLVWPDRFPADCPAALAAATRAAEVGAGARFALAATRLAFCGGFDLDDPEILAEAAAAAGLHPDDCLAAAHDPMREVALHATARGLCARGVRELPAIRIGRRWFAGEGSLDDAGALARTLRTRGGAAAGA